MQIFLNDKGYVDSYAIIGTLVNGIEIEEPTDLSHFEANFSAYHIVNNVLVFDENQAKVEELEVLKAELRLRRQSECFTVVDRSKLWYDTLTTEQLHELQTWYNAWLVVTDTLVVPTKPTWLH